MSSLKRNTTPVVLMQTLPLRRFDYKICLLIMAIFGVILSNAIERAYVIANKNKFHGLWTMKFKGILLSGRTVNKTCCVFWMLVVITTSFKPAPIIHIW